MSEENVLTKVIAEQFIADDDTVDLAEFSAIEDTAAKVLATYEGALFLEGLTSLSNAAAESLSKHQGECLCLDGLTSVSDAVAESLSKYKGAITFNGLISLSDTAAKSLSKCKGQLCLDGLTSLSNAAAESLSKHQGELLGLDGLTSLSDAAAESLSKYKGAITLDGLTCLSDTAAESLSKHNGELYLNGLTSLSDAAAESLASRNYELHVSLEIWPETMRGVIEYSQDPSLFDISELSEVTVAQVKVLAKTHWYLNLSGLLCLNDDVACLLGDHVGSLSLVNVRSISEAGAVGLARHQGPLFMNLDLLPGAATAILRNVVSNNAFRAVDPDDDKQN